MPNKFSFKLLNYIMEKKKIGIITLPFEPNYGWILQLWALNHFLCANGYDTEVLDRRWNEEKAKYSKNLIRWIYYNICCRDFNKFFNTKLCVSDTFRSSSKLSNYVNSNKFEAVVFGSDQIWRIENVRDANLDFFGEFIKNSSVKSIAYSASFGTDNWKGTKEDTLFVSKLLQGFSSVSVREDSGVEMCNRIFHINAKLTVDPTLLLKKSDYDILVNTKKGCDKIVTYILDSNHKKDLLINKICEYLHSERSELYVKGKSKFHLYKPISTWISSIKNAKFVVVDSFHGMVFSIIFHKQFLVICNNNRGKTRFTSLLSLLHLESRLVTENYIFNPDFFDSYIDYSNVEKTLTELRVQSADYLLKSLS